MPEAKGKPHARGASAASAAVREEPMPGRSARPPKARIRYAVVGLGHIAQVAVLPAFSHARANSRLRALVSGDPRKRKELGRRYRGVVCTDYDGYEPLLRSGEIDAVYLALPNHLHREFAVRAARAGIHVLCEKPMAVSEQECLAMIDAARESRVKLMIAYRLHFDTATLRTIETARSGVVGDLKLFSSVFTMQVRDENIRLEARMGGGPLYDIGIYCINAARNLFGAEPIEAIGSAIRGGDARFDQVEESFAAVLRFPGERIASFVCSFGAADVSSYRVVGTEGDVVVEPAYEYAKGLKTVTTVGERRRTQRYRRQDHFAPELVHFSRCVLEDREPEPGGLEGLIDVRAICALRESARRGSAMPISRVGAEAAPDARQAMRKPPVRKPSLVRAESASR